FSSVYTSRLLSYSQRKSSDTGPSGGGPSITRNIGLNTRPTAVLRCAKVRDEGVFGSQFRLRASSSALARNNSGSRVFCSCVERCSSSAVTISRCVFWGIFKITFYVKNLSSLIDNLPLAFRTFPHTFRQA